MNENKYMRICITSLRTLLLIFLTFGLSTVSRFIFVENMFGEEYFEEQVLNAWYMGFFLLIFNSLVIAIHSYDKYTMKKFWAKSESNRLLFLVKFILSSFEFYLELICIAVISLLLPADFLYGFVTKTFFHSVELTDFYIKLYTLIIILPLLFIIDFFARIIIAKKWYQNRRSDSLNTENEKKKKLPPTIKNVFLVVFVYCGASMVIPWLLPLFITLLNMAGGIGFLWIFLFIVTVLFAVIASYYIRAAFKRRDFIKKLKKYCKTNSLFISNIKKPYRSIFVSQSGFDFSLEKDGKKYDCKFIAGVFPGSPIIFSDRGNGIKQNTIRIFRVEIFHILTKINYDYDGEGKKILIVLPTPKTIYASTHDEPPRLADVGEKVGEYTIYNSTGFLGALDRNCL